jgi:hypothetical protein
MNALDGHDQFIFCPLKPHARTRKESLAPHAKKAAEYAEHLNTMCAKISQLYLSVTGR